MKRGAFCAYQSEFWIVGDFVSKVFMTWGGSDHRCYIDGADPTKAAKFSSYMNALKFIRSDENAAKWVEQQGGPIFVKPLRYRKSVVVYPPGVRP